MASIYPEVTLLVRSPHAKASDAHDWISNEGSVYLLSLISRPMRSAEEMLVSAHRSIFAACHARARCGVRKHQEQGR